MGKIVENEKKKYEDILTYQFSFFLSLGNPMKYGQMKKDGE